MRGNGEPEVEGLFGLCIHGEVFPSRHVADASLNQTVHRFISDQADAEGQYDAERDHQPVDALDGWLGVGQGSAGSFLVHRGDDPLP